MQKEYSGLGVAGEGKKRQRRIDRFKLNLAVRFPDVMYNFFTGHCIKEFKGTKGRLFPDLSYYEKSFDDDDVDPENLLVVFEFERCSIYGGEGLKRFKRMFRQAPTLREIFVYNYVLDKWTKYNSPLLPGQEVVPCKNCDWSEVLNVNLDPVLKMRGRHL